MAATFEFVTDTATFCIYDLMSLKHRLSDDADWWSVPEDEIAEVNAANIVFVGLGSDGKFTVAIVDGPPTAIGVAVYLKCPSGQVFLGSGEEVTGDGLEPECVRGGGFIDVPPGSYRVAAARSGNVIEVCLSPAEVGVAVRNQVNEPIRLLG
jgi:hypothetical protein